MFGPHETNLCVGRTFSSAHADYYAARACGGAGVIVTEVASVHPSDWPYERAPLAADCGAGWRRIAAACKPFGTVVLAGLGHTGLQGSSAHSQSALWGPAGVPDPATRELPMVMGPAERLALTAGFAHAARVAVDSGLDGVEVDAGPRSLLRQFLSDLTNTLADPGPLLEVLSAVREAMPDGVLALRLTCDELASWGGIAPAGAAELVATLAPRLDLLTVVRGGLTSVDDYRPGMSAAPGFNVALCRQMRAAAGGVPVVLQGSVVDPGMAEAALADGVADLVEMTRAQIAEPDLVAIVRAGAAEVRPCLLCNQACLVRDVRNPAVDCVVNPRTGSIAPATANPLAALVIGAGVAGLEAARTLAEAGVAVTVLDSADRAGGMVVTAAAARDRLALLPEWLESRCRELGVRLELGVADAAARAADFAGPIIWAVGAAARPLGFPCDRALTAAQALAGAELPSGPVLVNDPVGGPIGVAVAQWLRARGREVGIVTPDPVAGVELARAGDLVGANVRLQRAGITRHLYSELREVAGGSATIQDRHTKALSTVPCAVVVDCSPGVPLEVAGDAEGAAVGAAGVVRAGDCVAPRTVLEAMREGREAALAVLE